MTSRDVVGRCPACRGTSLFLAEGGFVTCARLECPDPSRVSDDLEHVTVECDRDGTKVFHRAVPVRERTWLPVLELVSHFFLIGLLAILTFVAMANGVWS